VKLEAWNLKFHQPYIQTPFEWGHTCLLGVMMNHIIWLLSNLKEDDQKTIEDRVVNLPPFPGLKKFTPGWIKLLFDRRLYAKEIDALKSVLLFCL
jgi:hypothetical protein